MAPKKMQKHSVEAGADDKRSKVAEVAYFIAESRGFTPGQELDDWVQAEGICAEDPGNRDA